MKTFEEFLSEYVLERINLTNGWYIRLLPHFGERIKERAHGEINLKELLNATSDAVSKWKEDPKVKDWDRNEKVFQFTKSKIQIVMNVNIPKKELRTITLLSWSMVPKERRSVVRIAEGEYQEIENEMISEEIADSIVEIIEIDA